MFPERGLSRRPGSTSSGGRSYRARPCEGPPPSQTPRALWEFWLGLKAEKSGTSSVCCRCWPFHEHNKQNRVEAQGICSWTRRPGKSKRLLPLEEVVEFDFM